VLAGAVNSVAGGGTLLTFPVLVWGCGLSEKIANATNTAGLVPASLMGARGFSGGARSIGRGFWSFYGVSIAGALVGSVLLHYTPAEHFKSIVPLLILMAAVIFLLQDTISRHILKLPEKTFSPEDPSSQLHPEHRSPLKALTFQFFIAVYGGYFGAGIGIMMLAALSLMQAGDIYRINFLKNLASTIINGVASIVFIILGLVDWPIAISMGLGAVIGGWGGAGIARRVGPVWARRMVSAVGFAIAAAMVYKQLTRP
jgi:uncharacterized membrane protein YfcA